MHRIGKIAAITAVALFATSPASACLKWASYGTFNLGSWGDNNHIVDAGTAGNHDKIKSNDDWRGVGDFIIATCQTPLNHHAIIAGNKWPEQRREIQVYFQGRVNACVAHFTKVYRSRAGQFCK